MPRHHTIKGGSAMILDRVYTQGRSNCRILLLALPFMALAACTGTPEVTNGDLQPGPLTWIDAPLSGETLPLEPYEVVSHANSSQGVTSFELSVNGQVYSSDEVPADQYGQPLAHVRQDWEPPAPGTYLLSVRALDTEGGFGQAAEVEVSVGEVEGVELEETPLSTPAEESTPTPTIEQVACTYTAVVNLFCRIGPSSLYPEIDTFIPGQTAPITGMSSDGFYWYVVGPHNGRLCTVPDGAKFGEVSGDCSSIPAFTPIPPPPATPTPTPTCTPGVVGCS